jgi:Protein of unknown function (DUF3089)
VRLGVAVLVAVGILSAPAGAATRATVWLCKPGQRSDPCTSSLIATRVTAVGATSVKKAAPAANSRFDCFYVYPTVSDEPTPNSDLRVQSAERQVAIAQASRFSQVCNVYAPMYRQVTLSGLLAHPTLQVPAAEGQIAYASLLSAFEDFVRHDDGRPIVFIGHSQGAAILIHLLATQVDRDAALRKRLVLAIVLGGDVEVKQGSLAGGSFEHIPLCSRTGERGCAIAYSSFPSEPPATSLFGRVGQGVALQSNQTSTKGLQVACVNPAALGGGTGPLDSFFPSAGAAPTPWVEYPGLYDARCESRDGAAWLQVAKATGASDRRPVVAETLGPDWGYHEVDVNLALGNLVRDVRAAEAGWAASH